MTPILRHDLLMLGRLLPLSLALVTIFFMGCQGQQGGLGSPASDALQSQDVRSEPQESGSPVNPGNSSGPGPAGPVGPASGPGPLGTSIEISKTELTLNESLEIAGVHFKPGEKVALLIFIDETLQPFIGGGTTAQATADAVGAFQISFERIGGVETVKAKAPGRRAVLAVGLEGSRASVPVRILQSLK